MFLCTHFKGESHRGAGHVSKEMEGRQQVGIQPDGQHDASRHINVPCSSSSGAGSQSLREASTRRLPSPLISWRESGGLGGAGLGPKSGNRSPAVRGKAQATWPVPGRPSPACLPAGLRETSRSVCGDREEVTAARKVTWCQHQAEPGDGPAGEKGLSLFPPGSAGRVCGINRQQAASRRRGTGLFIFNSCTWQYHRKKVNNKLARFESSYILLKGQG